MNTKTQQRLTQLIRTLQTAPSDAACETCFRALESYIAAQLAEQDYLALFPDIARHLDVCPACAGAYARLYELELAEQNGTLPAPASLPAPDLKFLRPTLLTAFQQTAERLTLQFSAALLPLLQPLPALATRAPSEDRYHRPILQLDPARAPGLPLTVTAYEDASQPEMCLLEVVVEPPGQSWPDLGGSAVTLGTGRTFEGVTDDWGVVSFEGIPVSELATMIITVRLQ